MKKIIIFFKKTLKQCILILASLLIIVSAILFIYRPTYAVFLEGDMVGYTDDKKNLQRQINDYIDDGSDEKYIYLRSMPEYRMTLLKKTEDTNDQEIIEYVKQGETTYYRYYAITENYQEKAYLETYKEAEEVVNTLKEKESKNINQIEIVEKYEEQSKEFSNTQDVINLLYVEPVLTSEEISQILSNTTNPILGVGIGSGAPNINIKFIRPVEGILSSRFGSVSSVRRGLAHTGLDIATSSGTPYRAAADGVVTFAGWKGSLGNMIVVTHENGVQTYYGHSKTLYVKVGDVVRQGDYIGEVGSTGNSTGPHLHLEVRVNGVAYDPMNYVNY